MRQKYTVGVLLLLVVSVIAWWTVQRGNPPRSADASSSMTTPGFVPDEEMVFEVRPSPRTVAADTDRAALQMRNKMDEAFNADPGLPRDHADEFIDAARELFLLYLDPDFDRWVEHCRRIGGEPYDSMNGKYYFLPDGGVDENFRERWTLSASQLRMSPFSIEQMSFRPLWVKGERRDHPDPPKFMGAGFRNGRSFPEDPLRYRATCYEVLIPIQSRSAEKSAPVIPMTLGIALWWDREIQRWIPYETRLYSNSPSSESHYFYFM